VIQRSKFTFQWKKCGPEVEKSDVKNVIVISLGLKISGLKCPATKFMCKRARKKLDLYHLFPKN
jgi:hypothetical protein